MRTERNINFGLIIIALILGVAPILSAQSCEYYISSGNFIFPDGTSITCYSGVLEYRNDPNAINIKDKGPIPVGAFYVTGITSSKGPNTIVLQPDGINDMYGRHSFLIHGDNSTNNASQGCIVMDPSGRQKVVDAYNKAKNNGAYLTLYVYR